MINLIEIKALNECLVYADRGLLPSRPGIYAIYVGRKLVYIGYSRCLRNRIASHEIIRFYIKQLNESNRLKIKFKIFNYSGHIRFRQERYLIHKHKPLWQFNGHIEKLEANQ